MAQSTAIIDQGKVYQGTAASAGGTFTADYAIPTDKAATLRAVCMASHATASHMDGAASLVAEYVLQNKNGTVTAPTAIASSNNPANATTATFVASAAQASDAGVWSGGTPTLAWSISGTNGRVTFTNTGASATVNVTVIISAIIVGST
jgi:hypothetical protein